MSTVVCPIGTIFGAQLNAFISYLRAKGILKTTQRKYDSVKHGFSFGLFCSHVIIILIWICIFSIKFKFSPIEKRLLFFTLVKPFFFHYFTTVFFHLIAFGRVGKRRNQMCTITRPVGSFFVLFVNLM